MKTLLEIAKIVGVSKMTIWRHVRKNNVTTHTYDDVLYISDDDSKKIINVLRNTGENVTVKTLHNNIKLSHYNSEILSQLFRGYVRGTDNTRCIDEFAKEKNITPLTIEEVQNVDNFSGILNDDIILIDVDSEEPSEILFKVVQDLNLKCIVHQTTRGKHFYFKNTAVNKCGSKLKLGIGLTCDIKVGLVNTLATLKSKNKIRPHIYGNEIGELPKFLTPVKSNVDFLKLSEGDGRNQTLFNYILTLQSADFSKDEARECIKLLNKYVLPEPLSDKELKSVLRDNAFKKGVFFKDKVFLFDKFANFIKNNYHIAKIDGRLHIYRDGIYVIDDNLIESKMVECIPNLRRKDRKEVVAYLEVSIMENKPHEAPNLIPFNNGVYDLRNEELLPLSPQFIFISKIPWDYNPNAYSDLCHKTLNKICCNDSEIRTLMEEMIGYCFYRKSNMNKCFILTGDKNNGKSTFLTMMKNLIGEKNTTALDLNQLGERFRTAELFGKLVNIGDDIEDKFIPETAIFKKLVTGDRVNVERKGQHPFDFNNYAKLLFSANEIPRIPDKTGAIKKRLCIIPFDATFSTSDADFDPDITDKLQQKEVMEYLIQIGLKGLKRLLKNKKFTKSEKSNAEMDDYELKNNPILGFVDEVEVENIINESAKDVYRLYAVYCSENGLKALGRIEFSRQLCKKFKFSSTRKRVCGKREYVFVPDLS